MFVVAVRCDGCNREQRVNFTERFDTPNGWMIVDGPYGHGEPDDRAHACSYDCLVAFANRQRRLVGGHLPEPVQ